MANNNKYSVKLSDENRIKRGRNKLLVSNNSKREASKEEMENSLNGKWLPSAPFCRCLHEKKTPIKEMKRTCLRDEHHPNA